MIFYNTILESVKEFRKFRFRSTAPFKDKKFQLTQHGEHLKTEQYWGSADHGEVDLESDVN